MTHPFHPLHGREFELFARRHCWGEERVYFKDEAGALCLLPASWTSLAAEDPLRVFGEDAVAFRVDDLLRLVALIQGLGDQPDATQEGV